MTTSAGSNEHVRRTVRDFILAQFLPGERPETVADDTPLISQGILDSIATIQLVSFLEQQFQIHFDAHEIGPDHLDTVNRIVESVTAKTT